jgi:hypothetical protein
MGQVGADEAKGAGDGDHGSPFRVAQGTGENAAMERVREDTSFGSGREGESDVPLTPVSNRRLSGPLLNVHTVVLFLIGTALFATALGQAPLYYSNQNQYFLHGIAQVDVGYLKDDWLTQTVDPTPVFSALVAFTVRYLHPVAFHIYYALLMGVYGASLLALFVKVVGPERARQRWPMFVALLVLSHAAIVRWASFRLLGNDYPWFLQSGVAGQYVLGAMFQPSSFGVLLLAAIALFAHGRYRLSSVAAGISVIFHPTYLLPAGLLVAGFLAALLAQRRFRDALWMGGLALLIVAPMILYIVQFLGPTSAKDFDEAQHIIADVRIPHHTRPMLWADEVALLQIGWTFLGVSLLGRRPLRRVLLAVTMGAFLLTMLDVVTGSVTLALLFPWRISVALVPVATATIFARLAGRLPQPGRIFRISSLVIVVFCSLAGVWIVATGQGYHSGATEEGPLIQYVRSHLSRGDVYLIPASIPRTVGKTRGSLSSDFLPVREKKTDARVIPPDLQGFRLATGAPIYVDFKSIPYRDVDVLEWRHRLDLAESVERYRKRGDYHVVYAFAHLHRLATHIVVPADQPIHDPRFEEAHADQAYRVYRLRAR